MSLCQKTYTSSMFLTMKSKLTKSLKFSAKINLDDVTMIYVGLSATFERSTMPILARV